MKSKLVLSALFAVCTSSISIASEDAAAFFRNDRVEKVAAFSSSPVASMVATSARASLGADWVNTAIALAKLESGFNCRAVGPRTRHGRARGVMQVMPASARALGYNPARLNECQHGIDAGIAHMRACISVGVKTHAQMAKCHVAGTHGWNRRLSKKAERYKNKYVRMASR